MMPARSAAQNGWIKRFVLIRPTARRKIAPAPALTNINTMGRKCSMPKITDSATAPAAAASAKSQVGAGGALAIAAIALEAASADNRPASTSSTARIAEATRSISTPLGSAAIFKLKLSPTQDDSGAQPKPPTETLSRADDLIGRLAVGEKHLCKI